MRVSTSISTNVSTTTNLQGSSHTAQAPPVGQQIQQVLFGRPIPRVVDPADFPELAAMLRRLGGFKKRILNMVGETDDDGAYDILLAEGNLAMIDGDAKIYLGVDFVAANLSQEEVLVGALAHEIGHRPKRWRALQHQVRRQLTKEEVDAICRHEETRADIVAGKALAELGMRWEPLAEFLLRHETGPHPQYFPAAVRAEVIRDAHTGRGYRAGQRKRLFPGFDRNTSPRNHIGDF